MRLLVWALIQYAWCPDKKGRLGQRHTQRKDHVKTEGEDSHLHEKKETSEETKP